MIKPFRRSDFPWDVRDGATVGALNASRKSPFDPKMTTEGW